MHSRRTFIVLAALCAVFSAPRLTRGGARQTDFDGDGRDDLAVYYAELGRWYAQSSINRSLLQIDWGWSEGRPVPGDYDGDKITDAAVYHRAAGDWYIRESSTGRLRREHFGSAGQRPVAADYDGDGRTDLALYERDTGRWMIRLSGSGTEIAQNFGWWQARPVPADYDGDGKADLAVFHRLSATWYILRSRDGSFLQENWGWSLTRPVPGDYDGDGRSDVAVYYPGSGTWYVHTSTSNSVWQQAWGWQQARPVPADYDGDGRADFAVYYRQSGTWYVRESRTGAMRQENWGWSQACPMPAYRDGGIDGLRILAFGDSITYGRGSLSNGPLTGYPALLDRVCEPILGGHFDHYNGGDPGESTDEGADRIEEWLWTYRPDLTLIMEGMNDMYTDVPNRTVEANLRSMVWSALAYGSSVILGTISPVDGRSSMIRAQQEDLIEEFNPYIRELGASMGVPVADVWSDMTAVADWEDTLIADDEHHPNDQGYRVIRDSFLRQIELGTLAGQLY